MTDLERAMADVAFIQQRLAASTRFDGLAPHAVAASGVLAIAAALAQAIWPRALAADPVIYVMLWSAVALVAVLIIAGEALGRSYRLHGTMADMLIASALRLLLPFIVTGGALALVILRFAPATAWILPGLWQMLIALIGFSAATILPRAIIWPAGWYFASGVIVLIHAAQTEALDPWMMGLPFGIGQIAAAIALHGAMRGTRG